MQYVSGFLAHSALTGLINEYEAVPRPQQEALA
jgi:hypothetical protein